MAKLQRYTQISHGFGEEGPDYSFVNLAYNEDNESTEDIERRWTFEDETKFKPRKKRCTKFNVAVAVFILAAGGLAVFLIVKLSQDHEKVYTTPQPGPLGGSTKIPSTTSSLPSTSELLTSTTMETSKTTVTMHTTMMTSSSPTALSTSTSGPPLTSTLSTPSSTQTTTTNSSKSPTSTPITAPSPTTTTRPSTTSTSPLSTTLLTATTAVQTSSTPTPITKTTLSSVTTAAPQLSTDSSTETTTTILTTTSGTSTTSQSLMTTTSLPENSTATATTIITSSTSASTIPSTTTTPIPKSSSSITTLLPTTTAISNVVTTTQEITTHTTANGTNNTEDASMMFDASMTVTSIAWDENYSNSSSDAYQKLISNFTNQVEEGIKSSEVGSSFSHVTITAVSPGSVVFDFRIHMTSSSYQSGGSQETITHSVVSTVLVKIVQRAKVNGTETMLSGVNETNIVVQTVIETTKSLPSTTTKMMTALPTATTLKESESTSSQTTATTPTVTTTTMSTTISPCANSTYLSSTLISFCFDSSRLNEVGNASEVVKCRYILSAVDCVLDKIRLDFGINCTNEHKLAALNEFTGIVQLYLGIDPENCDLPVTMPTTMATKTSSSGPATPSPGGMTTSKPTMKTPFPTSISPCTNSSYLSMTLLSYCINLTQINEVANASDSIKCNFILSAVDCVLEKIRLDFEINCTEENKLAALEEFSGVVKFNLLIDPEICVLPIIMSTTTTELSPTTTIGQPSTTKTTTLSSTTTMQSVATPPITTRLTTTTGPTTINPCMNSTYLSSILSQSSCIADSNQLEEVKNASDEVKCNYISSIVDCVLDGVRSDINITCSDKKKIVTLYEIKELRLSYLSIDLSTCDLSVTNSTTTPSARTTLSPAATTAMITTTPVTTMTTKTTNKLTTPPLGITMTTKTTNKLTTPPPVTTATAMKTTTVTTTS